MKAWRQACEEALRAHSEADALRFWGTFHAAGDSARPHFDYRFEHTLAAVKIARWLAPLVGADTDVVESAAWLHDCRKRLNDHAGKDTHAEEASAAAVEVLRNTDFPSAKIPAVRHAIENHVGLRLEKKLEPIETACLWDADKLSKIGAASLIHFACISGGFQPVTTELILERGTTWLDLAKGIVESMNTTPAKLEAEKRLAFLQRHYQQLRREWSEPMETAP